MPSLDQFCRHFFLRQGIGRTILIGSLLAFIPIVNLLALGYLWRTAERVRRGQLDQADWLDLARLAVDGVKLLILLIVYLGVPVTVGWLLAVAVNGFGVFGGLPYIFVSAGLIAGAILLANAVYCNAGEFDWIGIFGFRTVFELSLRTALSLVIPVLAFWGFVFLGAPLYGIAFFCGMLVFLSYSLLVIRFQVANQSA